ncbi:carbamoyl-phosphate synthase large subunit [Tindallia californiensis]|uniref:Carbamoyl phosphate synthase large chain n=1 Tax=Tindallia californiensis TaxID=159292 RepID=A0A1H3R1X8_9FIRM|nr:carbamoyl-phosphate synthase large subunit [Tindallia californiensis]SDZ19824.1 carbamoyl-phosphate synthase large subunit [Tindallia californiensis]
MPKKSNIKKVLVIGSGPIVIGQAAEFDYSGTQACQALKEEGVEVVLINSNPATIMTDKAFADKIYLEPLTLEFVEKILDKERPDSLMAGMGGQTALNLAVELHDSGALERYNVQVIGTSIESIKEGEDRERFKAMMERIDQPVIESRIVTNLEEGVGFAQEVGYPVIIRPAYTLGGTGGGMAYNEYELEEILSRGLHLSRVGQVLLEKSVLGWKEIEYEVMRDANGTCITVCNMENIDPVGVHTGDSIVIAPVQTLSDKEHQMLRTAAIDIINAVGIEGGCNVQFAMNPKSFEYAVIEINPRVSRSSALASKATGYPIAKVASKIALGYGLDEIKNAVTGKTYACFEPTLDYVVVKIPKWPFDKFRNAKRSLGTKMMATGEVMALGNNFEAALLKGIRSLEIGRYSFINPDSERKSLQELKAQIQVPDDERIFDLAEMLRRNYRVEKVSEITGIDPFFIQKIQGIVLMEEELKEMKSTDLTPQKLRNYKQKGFSDKGMADIIKCSPQAIYGLRNQWNIHPVYKMVDTCAGEFEAQSPYYYSTYDSVDEVNVTSKRKIMVIGSGPIRIGQGIEFDYCSVHSILALRKAGLETIMVNNNPETVSTDFDISDKLYFEPLTEEDVLNIAEKEKPEGVILQFGGQTAIKLADFFQEMNIPILGTQPTQIDTAEDREKFEKLMDRLKINRPQGKAVWSLEEGLKAANFLGYPVLVRPSYVLGGRGMEITRDELELKKYLKDAFEADHKNPVLIDRYLMGREIEVDAIFDGKDVLIPGIMEHLDRAGVHSGDSTSLYPAEYLTIERKKELLEVTKKVAKGLEISGMVSIQFIEFQDNLYLIEVNPRSSRTVPYISKVTGVPVIELATRVMLGERLQDMGWGIGLYKEEKIHTVKVPVFSTEKLPMVEVSLGPEMRSTGEVLGIGKTSIEAMYKGLIAAGITMPQKGGIILATINLHEHQNFARLAKRLHAMGYTLKATSGTAETLSENMIPVETVKKIKEGVPNLLDLIRSGTISLIVNTPTKGNDNLRDGFRIRRIAVEAGVPLITSLDILEAMIEIMEKEVQIKDMDVIEIGGIA